MSSEQACSTCGFRGTSAWCDCPDILRLRIFELEQGMAEQVQQTSRCRFERDEMAHVNALLIEMTDWLRRNFSAVGDEWDERWRRRTLTEGES